MKNFFKRFKNLVCDKHPFKKTLQNCPCYDADGNFIGWYSRSCAVITFAFAFNRAGERCILAAQRGKGTPDPEFVGAWNAPCGYLDFHETLEDACRREMKEETGVILDDDVQLDLVTINDKPNSDKRQNVCFIYSTLLPHYAEYYEEFFSHDGNEKDEVDDIRFIPISKMNDFRWAFGHDEIILKCLKRIL